MVNIFVSGALVIVIFMVVMVTTISIFIRDKGRDKRGEEEADLNAAIEATQVGEAGGIRG